MYVHRTGNVKEFSYINKYCIQINFVLFSVIGKT